MSALIPGLIVIHGNRLEELRALAVQWMRAHPLRPLENEVLLVQSNGIAQWLKLALAEQDGCGIAAATDVSLPARFLWQAYRAVLGREAIAQQSPLDKAPLTWRLMRMLPELLGEPCFAPLQRFLSDDSDLRKRHQLAARLADIFDQYQVYRADWLEDWARGRDQMRTARGALQALDAAALWQPMLWRKLLDDVGDEPLALSRAGVHGRFIARLAELRTPPPDLPRRVTLFGLSSLPAQMLEALAAMARFSQVMLYVHNPSQYHWGDTVEDKELLRHAYRRQQRKALDQPAAGGQWDLLAGLSLQEQGHPLLAAWGKQGRDYINLLDQYDEPQRYRGQFERIDLFSPMPEHTLLGQLQNDILDLRTPAQSRAHWPAVDVQRDTSVRFHLVHSVQREVEVLHDQLLAAFNEDPTLRPRDVIVMVPDVNAYAASIQAVFGQFGKEDPRYIPVTLSDQGQRGKAPLLIALEYLLRLPDSRFSVSAILDLLDVAAVRARFALDAQALPLLRRWLEGAGVRWGLNAEQRASLGLAAGLEQNTWRFGLQRMLLGYAVGSAGARAGIEPYDEIGGLDAALIGPLTRLLETLQRHCALLAEKVSPALWGERLRDLLDDFFLPQDEQDEVLRSQALETLEHWLGLCEAARLEDALPLTVVREAWLNEWDQGRLSQRFLAGAVNVCTLMPMRAIPFRYLCLLGMNDGDYPRSQAPLDFDLMGRDYRPGDRSRREDDRYLLLEALLSVRERLYISWIGRSIRDNSERPPSVLIGQLRDHLGRAWRLPDGGDLLQALTTVHPLQPFSRRYFSAAGALFSYAHEWALLHRTVKSPVAQQALPKYQPAADVSLQTLQRFLRDPVKYFFTQRLKVHLDEQLPPDLDSEPFVLDALPRHQLQQALLQAAALAVTRGEDVEQALQRAARRVQRSGLLPVAGFGERLREQLLEPVPRQLHHYQALLQRWPQPLSAPIRLRFEHAQLQLDDWLGELLRGDEGLARLELQAGTLKVDRAYKWHRLLGPWIHQVVAAACGYPLNTFLVAEDGCLALSPVSQEAAEGILCRWLQAYTAGLQAPLPVAMKTAATWLAGADRDAEKARQAARRVYEGDGFNRVGEVQQSASLGRHFASFDALWGDGDFAHWSALLYGDLLRASIHEPQELQA
jgi:exodeoxyribonuclease V gamma subunit